MGTRSTPMNRQEISFALEEDDYIHGRPSISFLAVDRIIDHLFDSIEIHWKH